MSDEDLQARGQRPDTPGGDVDIKARIDVLRRRIADHELEIEKIKLDIEKVRLDCPHSNRMQRVIGYADRRWTECADCGKKF